MSGGYYCTNCGCCFRTPGSGVITCTGASIVVVVERLRLAVISKSPFAMTVVKHAGTHDLSGEGH